MFSCRRKTAQVTAGRRERHGNFLKRFCLLLAQVSQWQPPHINVTQTTPGALSAAAYVIY
jgi:hypothetical protein